MIVVKMTWYDKNDEDADAHGDEDDHDDDDDDDYDDGGDDHHHDGSGFASRIHLDHSILQNGLRSMVTFDSHYCHQWHQLLGAKFVEESSP